ncbi:MAG TPA: kelch repeat-containing protein [Chitinophagales bacterium]|nr:kelch repeat-containing protein [Chitinophagales bacterium]
MKKNLLLFFLTSIFYFLSSPLVHAQSGEWTWMKGDSIPNSLGTFGTIGIPNAANKPPGLYEPCEWRDHDGNFWLFGGSYSYNTLWKFETTTSEWTWMKGTNGVGGTAVYGTQGVSDPNNTPGARLASTSWVDNDGNLWLYGGVETSAGKSDLWKYEVTTNEWTWMDGSSGGNALGVYGTKGIPDPLNDPGARLETAAAWVDDANNLWFFGGQLCCNANGYIDDVWRYNTTTGEWTWMQGSSISLQPPAYGTLGIADSANTPGNRRIYSHWKDADGNFWIFGGQANGSCFNDLWKYDHNLNLWTWMHGSNIVNSTGHYGTSCTFDSLNEPPARMENRFYWTDSCSNFWMFGGLNTSSGFYHNDLWCYSPAMNKWKWTSGSSLPNQDGLYGTMGVSSSSNHPGARYGGVAWLGHNESLWLFGGHGYPFDNNVGDLNDLWRFIPDSGCVSCNVVNLPGVAFQSSDTSLCEKFCISFTDQSINNPTSWQWIFQGGNPSSSTDQNPTNICYDVPGAYDVTLITTNAYGSDTLTLPDFITVYATPPFPTITQVGYTLTSSPANSYQWQFNSADIPGATNQSYAILQTGLYTVVVSDSNGCVNSATTYVLISGIDETSGGNIFISPNPSNGNFIVELPNGPDLIGMVDEVSIDVVNTLGQNIFSSSESRSIGIASHFKKEIDLSGVAGGVYFIVIKSQNIFLKNKIIITK